jgi:hypothetical protein
MLFQPSGKLPQEKKKHIEEPRVPEHSRSINIETLPSHRFV